MGPSTCYVGTGSMWLYTFNPPKCTEDFYLVYGTLRFVVEWKPLGHSLCHVGWTGVCACITLCTMYIQVFMYRYHIHNLKQTYNMGYARILPCVSFICEIIYIKSRTINTHLHKKH